MEDHFDIVPAEPAVKEVIEVEPTLEGTEVPTATEPEPEEEREEVGNSDEEYVEELVVEKKIKLTNDEVFAPTIAPVKKPRKKRKPMTQAQLDNLAKAREKANATRAKNKKEREDLELLKSKVAKKRRAKQEQEILAELSDDEIPEPMKVKKIAPIPKQPAFTAEQIANAVASGVESYDRKRKAEKKVKKDRQAVEQQTADVRMKVQKAIDPNSHWDQFLM
tara:strand:- start:85 stop:747 length:663 start_codon:yes stop_codon:yes gene_type:complete